NGQEIASLPGLVTLTPPQNVARGREKDRLIAYLLLTGTATFSTSEYLKIAQDAANLFYKTSGALTSALRTAADLVNKTLLDRNMTTTAQGQYAVGWLTLAAVRDTQCTFALSGPMHVYWFGQNESRHIHEPAVSGKGLGSNQTINIHYAQTSLSAGDRLLFFGRAPSAWDGLLNDAIPSPSSLDAMRRRLSTLTGADLNAVLMQATDGMGALNLLKGTTESKELSAPPPASPLTESLPPKEETFPTPEADSAAAPSAHTVQPSAYSIPPQHEESIPQEKPHTGPLTSLPRSGTARDFPASIPRAQAQPQPVESEPVIEENDSPVAEEEADTPAMEKIVEPVPVRERRPRVRLESSKQARQAAKALAGTIQFTRRMSDSIGGKLKNFMPRLLPNADSNEPLNSPSNGMMMFLAVLIPLMVVTMLSVVYLRIGRSQQYDTYMLQAQEMKAQALSLTDPVEQRKAWENVVSSVDIAESHRKTPETISLRDEAGSHLDTLLGVTRLQFNPAFSSNLGIEISRMAASESDLFMLNAANGEVLRASPAKSGRGFELDTTFNCKPGVYGNYTVGPLVDILALPLVNSIDATVLGIDATGNLLYCAPNQVGRAIPLPTPDTNWGRVTAFIMDAGNLYVLDAPARAVWVYIGKDGAFIDQPYFFFGGQTPEKQDVIDLVVSGDDLYMLHSDGHLSTCSYSRINSASTRCEDPMAYKNPFEAYRDTDLFASAHFTQMLFTALPDQSILLLDADSSSQGVFRFSPRTLDLQNQFRPKLGVSNPIPAGPIGAIAVGANHVLYLGVNGQVYFATDMP
ncbi:MAG: hypothetical protein HY863_04080, partial [Chloroflexi bacterium]|nr:hypothetical protein [Chloroflexota bacterium]